MPKKATKRGSEAALRQSHSTARFAAADGGGAPSDPPIIVTGGGSVTIYSKVELTRRASSKEGYPYEYYTAEVTAKRIRARGRAANFDDVSDGGFFEFRVFDR